MHILQQDVHSAIHVNVSFLANLSYKRPQLTKLLESTSIYTQSLVSVISALSQRQSVKISIDIFGPAMKNMLVKIVYREKEECVLIVDKGPGVTI